MRLNASTRLVGGDPNYIALRASGELSRSTVSNLRDALLKCVAEQPAGVIVEVDSLRVRDRECLAIFTVLIRWAAACPGFVVVLARPTPHVRGLLRWLGIDRLLPVVATMAEARREVRRPAAMGRVSQRLAPVPESIPVGRWIAARACDQWGLAAVAQPASQIVTELVGNAVQHAGTPIDLVLTYAQARFLHIAVHDGSVRLPRPRTPDSAEDNGRGLLVVEAFANGYGAVPTRDGKVVWASLLIG
jgi:ABC-type transporter Mla MlaB component